MRSRPAIAPGRARRIGQGGADAPEPSRNEFIAYVIDQMRRWAPVSARRLFGGHGVYRGETMFAIVARDTLYFRTDAVNRPDFEALAMPPLRVGKTSARIALSYHEVPADILEEPDALAQWAARAYAAALRRDEAQARRPKHPPRHKARAAATKRRKG